MSRLLALAIVLAACRNHATARRDAMVIDAPARTDAPAPSPGSWVASPPRDEWPCGDIIDEDRGLAARAITLFRYGDRTACHLPATLVERGITGCPESYTRTDPDGRVRTYALHYDPAGTMTQPDALPDAPPRTRVETFACPDDAAPVKLSFVRFDRAAKRQSVIVRAENPTAHVVYRIGWQTRYRDAEGNIVPFATNLGMMSHDDNSWWRSWPLLRPHETTELALPVNYTAIPAAATHADFLTTALADREHDWYSRPLDPDNHPRR